jgi:hypothetical protein
MFTVTNARTGEEYGTTLSYGKALELEALILKLNGELELVVVVKARS